MSTEELKKGYLTDEGDIVTPRAVASFPHVFHKQPPDPEEPGKEPKYAITLLFREDADLTLLKEACIKCAEEEWGEDVSKWPEGWKKPFRDQSEKKFEGYVPGCKFITVTSKYKPEVLGPSAKFITDESAIYAGAIVRASVKPFAYKKKGNVGIAFGLSNVQKLDDGDRLGGGPRAQSQFKPVTPDKGAPASGSAGNKAALFDD